MPLGVGAGFVLRKTGGGGGGGGSWDPSSLPNHVAWLRGDLGITLGTGSNVAAWADQYGVQAAFSQSTGANQPTAVASVINGQSIVRAVGAEYLTSADSTAWHLTSDYTITIVMALASVGTYSCILAKGSTGTEWDHYIDTSAFFGTAPGVTSLHNGGVGYSGPVSGLTGTTPQVIQIRYSATGSSFKYLQNGTLWHTAGGISAAPSGSNTVGLFARPSGGNQMAGDIAELIVISSVIGGTDITNLNSYITSRYGITMGTD